MAIRSLYLSNIVRVENQKNSPEINYYDAACMLLIKSFIFGPKNSYRNLYIMDSKERHIEQTPVIYCGISGSSYGHVFTR